MEPLFAALHPFHLQRSFTMTPLRQRMLEDMGIRNLAENTQLCYLQQVSRYARHFDRSPEELGPEQIRTYQVHLTKTCKLAPSTISIATAALRFLYKVTLKRDWAPDDIPMPKKLFNLPVVLSPEEVAHFLARASTASSNARFSPLPMPPDCACPKRRT
jgi:site-specific recombinase XerD